MTIRISGAMRLAMLGGLLLATAAWAQKGPVPTVFNDDFANPATGWDVETNPQAGFRLEYAGGQYVISAPSQSQLILATNGLEFADGRIAVEATVLPMSPLHPHGIFVRAQGYGDFYGFGIVQDGSFLAFHQQNTEFFADAEGVLPLGLYRTDGPNLIEAAAAGGQIQYFVNGQLIATVTNVLWASGVVGLLATNTSDQPAGAAFDNWRAEVVR